MRRGINQSKKPVDPHYYNKLQGNLQEELSQGRQIDHSHS